MPSSVICVGVEGPITGRDAVQEKPSTGFCGCVVVPSTANSSPVIVYENSDPATAQY